MRRLNVRFTQIEECIEKAIFAVDSLPRNPALQRGEILLLQMVKNDAARLGKLSMRVEFGLVFEQVQHDPTGALSQKHWPRAGKVWKYLLLCSETVPAIPFSLEQLDLSQDYSGQNQCALIAAEDEPAITEYLQPEFGRLQGDRTAKRAILQAIRNYDVVLRLTPERTAQVGSYRRTVRDPWPADALKTLYGHRCQVCTQDFLPRYGIPYADVRFIQPIDSGGSLQSSNRLVVCPNHNAILGITRAILDFKTLSFEYPNNLRERLLLTDHLVELKNESKA